MAWVIWTERKGRKEFVRRINPVYVSWTVSRTDAARYPTKAEATEAAAEITSRTGLTLHE